MAIYIYMCVCVYIYIYIYIERERDGLIVFFACFSIICFRVFLAYTKQSRSQY